MAHLMQTPQWVIEDMLALWRTWNSELERTRIGDTARMLLTDRRALPPDGPDIGPDVPGGGAI